MRFVDDHGLGTGQKFDEAFFLHRKIRQQQVMVDDNEVRFLRRLARFDNMTL